MDPVVVVSRKNHRLQRDGRLKADRLGKERWAMSAAETLPVQWLLQRWRELSIQPPHCVAQSSSFPTLLSIVAETDALTFQSWAAVRGASGYGTRLRPLECEELTWRRNLGVTLRDYGYISPTLDNFIRILRETARAEDAL